MPPLPPPVVRIDLQTRDKELMMTRVGSLRKMRLRTTPVSSELLITPLLEVQRGTDLLPKLAPKLREGMPRLDVSKWKVLEMTIRITCLETSIRPFRLLLAS